MASTVPPFSADVLNRYRLIHNDKDLRSVVRRLNKLPQLATPDENGQVPDAAVLASATEVAQLELETYRLGVERMLVSARTIGAQADSYLRTAEETAARTKALKQTLAEEKALLVKRLAERDNRVKCDEVAKKILARGKTRKELEAQIAVLQDSITDQRAAYEGVLAVAQARSDAFAAIVAQVEACRALKLPESTTPEPPIEEDAAPTAPAASKLSATTLPFQPTASASASSSAVASAARSSAPASRGNTPPTHPHAHAHAHGLPSRPARAAAGGRYTRAGAALPSRPSTLRNVRPGLEDGEVGEEDGEVKEAAAAAGAGKRKAPAEESAPRTRRK